MKPLFHVLAILAIGAGIYLSYDLSKKFEEQQSKRIVAINKNKEVTADAVATEKEASDEHSKLRKAQDEQTETEQSISTLNDTYSGYKREMAEQEAKLDSQKAEFNKVEAAITRVQDIMKGIGDPDVNIDNLAEKVKEIEDKKIEQTKKSEELAELVVGATKKRDGQKAEEGRLADAKSKRDSRIRRNSMVSVITAVNQEWGFVMVGAGSNTGFTPQTKLLVERDGRTIGKINPTAIEATQTVADIDFGSLSSGVRLQPGDRVILLDPATN
jgi:predicted RNase H-like nuclease (RuvC/YqgF family)